jgi:DNA-binding response OmpR family regulator
MGQPSAAKTILIADDDADLRTAIARVLAGNGYRVLQAADGEECLRLAAEQRPDLVLLDLVMPVKSGFETCEALRRLSGLAGVPIIALTAFGENIGEIHGLMRDGDSCPIQDCLEKPVEFNVLLQRIRAALGRE